LRDCENELKEGGRRKVQEQGKEVVEDEYETDGRLGAEVGAGKEDGSRGARGRTMKRSERRRTRGAGGGSRGGVNGE